MSEVEKRVKVTAQVTIPVYLKVEVSFEDAQGELKMNIHGGEFLGLSQPRITDRFLNEHLSEDQYADIKDMALEAWRKF